MLCLVLMPVHGLVDHVVHELEQIYSIRWRVEPWCLKTFSLTSDTGLPVSMPGPGAQFPLQSPSPQAFPVPSPGPLKPPSPTSDPSPASEPQAENPGMIRHSNSACCMSITYASFVLLQEFVVYVGATPVRVVVNVASRLEVMALASKIPMVAWTRMVL